MSGARKRRRGSTLAIIAAVLAVVLYVAAGVAVFVEGDYERGIWLLLLALINQRTSESARDAR